MSYRWLFTPRPKQGESLLSLVIRAAAVNGVHWRQLVAKSTGIKARVDPDLFSGNALESLAYALNLTTTEAGRLGLSQFTGELLTDLTPRKNFNWLIPSNGEASQSLTRQSTFCPICLASPETAFLKLHWRLALATHCEIHDCQLIDACNSCGKTLQILSSELGTTFHSNSLCLHCGASLTSTANTRLDSLWFPYQNSLLNPDNSPIWTEVGATFPYQFLAGVRVLLSLVRLPSAGRLLRHKLASTLNLEVSLLEDVNGKKRFETLPIKNRQCCLEAIGVLLPNWPKAFVDICRSTGVKSSTFTLIERETPYWLHKQITAHLVRKRYSMSKAEVLAANILLNASGSSDSRTALSRLVGTRDSKQMDALYSRKRRRMVRDEAEAFFIAASAGLSEIPEARSERECASRTLFIMALSAVSGLNVENLSQQTIVEGEQLVQQHEHSLRELGANTIWQSSVDNSRARFFMSRHGGEIRGATTRMIASRLIKRFGPDSTWPSADSIIGVLKPPYPHNSG